VTAQEGIRERVFVHTDKECYVAGEDIWMKFYTVNQNFQPSVLSKVGYVELCDNQKPWMQLKLALDEGIGAGKIRIPSAIPSGIYRLSGYTRYMRNESENTFFTREIAIINVGLPPDTDKVGLIESGKRANNNKNENSVLIKTDKNKYAPRNPVNLLLENVPDGIHDLVVSVYRDDSVISPLKTDKENWKKQVVTGYPITTPLKWDTEYEGHIIEGRIIPKTNPDQSIVSTISFVGNDIKYINGKVDQKNGTVSFFTSGVYEPREVVTTITTHAFEKIPNRIDIVSPFSENLPNNLPVLQIDLKEKQLLERYVGAQLNSVLVTDSLRHKGPSESYYNLPITYSYDLDEYTRFNTLNETILEFIDYVRVVKVEEKRRISLYLRNKKRFNTGNVLILLDGTPVYDHENLLNYNPQYIKRINIYEGQYVFGKNVFEGMISFITHQQNLPFFQLDDDSQLFIYDCPVLPPRFEIPDYSEESVQASRRPDFRHTLYWNPFIDTVPEKSTQLSFYTSDLCGRFKVEVEGITRDGEIIYGNSYFDVSE